MTCVGRTACTHLRLLGAGGYHVETTAQAWCRIRATANRIDSMPDSLTVLGGVFLGAGDLQGAGIVDMAYRVTGEEKDAILAEIGRIVAFHETHTLPWIGERRSRGN